MTQFSRFQIVIFILWVVLITNAFAVKINKKSEYETWEHLPQSNKPKQASFTYYAYVDTSYNYLVRKNRFTNSVYDRLFDIEENGFTLQQFGFMLDQSPPEGLGGRLRVLGGADANRATPSGWDPYFGSQTLAMYPAEGYVQYKINQFTALGGVVDSLAGIESDVSSEDINFSRSILADAQPGTNLGIRTIYHWNDSIDLYAGLGNGFSTFRNPTQLSMLELAMRYNPTTALSIDIHGVNGPQYVARGAVSGNQSIFTLIDVVASYKPASNIEFAMNGDYYTQQKGQLPAGQIANVVWQGIAGYFSYDFTDQWRLGIRAEVFDDNDGFAFGIIQSWREATATLQYKPRDFLILRAETRRDFSNVNSFVNSNGVGTSNNQQSFAIEGIYLIK